MVEEKSGQIVWHDLFSSDRQRAMEFYRDVAGWQYVTEHSTDFAWGGGEKDFVLATLGGEAGAGIAKTPPEMSNGWIAYVEVEDVDAAAALAEKLGGTLVRKPFEVPGVGRNALIRDPFDALIGLALSRHDYPIPKRQFGTEMYLSGSPDFPGEFYSKLFGWRYEAHASRSREVGMVYGPTGIEVARHVCDDPVPNRAVWIPNLKVELDHVSAGVATSVEAGSNDQVLKSARTALRDPDGVPFCLSPA